MVKIVVLVVVQRLHGGGDEGGGGFRGGDKIKVAVVYSEGCLDGVVALRCGVTEEMLV